MSRVETALEELIAAVIASEEYRGTELGIRRLVVLCHTGISYPGKGSSAAFVYPQG